MQVRKDKSNTKLMKEFETWKKKAKEKINDMKKGKLTKMKFTNEFLKINSKKIYTTIRLVVYIFYFTYV